MYRGQITEIGYEDSSVQARQSIQTLQKSLHF